MKEYLTIKEFSKLSGIEATTLRYWDEVKLFVPTKRDPETNYRYYSPHQVLAVNYITVLSKLNVLMRTIRENEDTRCPERIDDLLEKQEKRLDKEMSRLREAYSIVHTRRELIKQGIRAESAKISLRDMEEMRFNAGSPCDFKEGESFYDCYMRFCHAAENLRINLSFPIGAAYGSMREFGGSPCCPERFFSVDPTGNECKAKGLYVVGYAHGFYWQYGELPQRMERFIEENELECSGSVYVIYLWDEISVQDPSQYLSQVSVAVSRKKSNTLSDSQNPE